MACVSMKTCLLNFDDMEKYLYFIDISDNYYLKYFVSYNFLMSITDNVF